MDLVLAIESDTRQAAILRRVMRERALAELVLVDSKDAAIRAIDTRVPDLLLVTALLSPRDEEELVAHLRGLDGAEHLQTLTIPQLAGSAQAEEEESRGLFGAFRRKKSQAPVAGCDPSMFAEEILSYLYRAREFKAERYALAESRRLSELVSPPPAPSEPAADASAPADANGFNEPASGFDPAAQNADPWASAPDAWSASPGRWEPQQDGWASATPEPEPAAPVDPPPVDTREASPQTPDDFAATPSVADPSAAHAGDPDPVSHPVAADPQPATVLAADPAPSEPPAARPRDFISSFRRREPPPRPAPPPVEEAPVAAEPIEPSPEPIEAAPEPIEAAPEPIELAREESVPEPIEAPEPVTVDPALAIESRTPATDAFIQADAPAPTSKRKPARRVSKLTQKARPIPAPLPVVGPRLTPLSIWARTEWEEEQEQRKAPAPERCAADELRELAESKPMPAHIWAVSYPKGCRIRRVRVTRKSAKPRPDDPVVILSKKALEESRRGQEDTK